MTLEKLCEDGFFPVEPDQDSMAPVHTLVQRWRNHFKQGRFRLPVSDDVPLGASTGVLNDFWTWPDSYGAMPERAPALLTELQKAGLVLFQGVYDMHLLTG